MNIVSEVTEERELVKESIDWCLFSRFVLYSVDVLDPT